MVSAYQFLDKISIGSLIIDADYTVHFWNQILENWTGVKKTDIIGKKIHDFFKQFKQMEIQARLNSVFSFGTPVIFSSQIHKYLVFCELPNHKFRYQQTMVTAIKPKTENGKYLALFSIQDVTDITEKIKQYKEAAQLVEERNIQLEVSKAELEANQLNLRKMIEFSKDAIVIMKDNEFKFYNSSLKNMLECQDKDIETLTFDKIQENDVLTYEKLWSELQENESLNYDLKFNKKDHEIMHVNAHFKKTIFNNEESIVGIFRDISNQVEILEALRHDLKQTVESGDILTVCSSCHKIKDNCNDDHKWMKLEEYLAKHVTNTEISHGLCDICFERYYPNEYEKYKLRFDSAKTKQKK